MPVPSGRPCACGGQQLPFKGSDNLQLRKADQGDKNFAYEVKKAAFKEYVEQAWGWDEDVQRMLHDRRFGTQDLCIISLNGKDVGFMSVAIELDCVHINQLYILPGHQGKGIGGSCMSVVIKIGSELSLPVTLRVLKINPRAVAFYERLGFTITGDTDTHVLMHKAPDSISHAPARGA